MPRRGSPAHWDWLRAEGFAPSTAARLAGVTVRVAYGELVNARERALARFNDDQDTLSRKLENDAYQALLDWGKSAKVPLSERRPHADTQQQDRTFNL